MGRFRRAIAWYMHGGLLHPLYIILAILPAVLLTPYIHDRMFDGYLMLYVDLTIMPLASLMAALHIVREPQVTVFEINLLRSVRIIYLARLAVYLIALSLCAAPIAIVLHVAGRLEDLAGPLVQRVLTYLVIASVALLLESRRGALIYLITFMILIPYATPILINRAKVLGYKLDPITTMTCYIIAPITTAINSDLLSMPVHTLNKISLIITIVIVATCYKVYTRKEFIV